MVNCSGLMKEMLLEHGGMQSTDQGQRGARISFPLSFIDLAAKICFFLKQDHGLDMMGLGEHVNRLEPFDGKAGTAQLAQIPAQGGGVTGDIDQPLAGKRCQLSCKTRSALSGRVDDHAVKAPAFCRKRLAALMDGAFLEKGVGEPCSSTVFSGRADS